jgi:ClpP class serine protease
MPKQPARTVIAALTSAPMAITEDHLRLMLSIAARENLDVAAVEAQLGRKLEHTYEVRERNGVAILPVVGPIFRYANLFSQISGGASVQLLAQDFNAALNNPDVRAILLNIDSPGGEANGIGEFADMVYAARGRKPITAYVGGYACSAAYWIASAADEIVASDSAVLGSIGTIAAIPDPSVEHEGEVIFVSSQSPRKHADPTTEAGASDIQAILDAMTDVFMAGVARNRGVSAETVASSYGRGGVFVGGAAVTAGLADRLGAFEQTLAGMGRGEETRVDLTAKAPRTRREPTPAVSLPNQSADAAHAPATGFSSGIQSLHLHAEHDRMERVRASVISAPLASVPARKNDTTTSTTKEKPMADEPTTNDGAPAISEEMRAQIAAQALANAGEQLTSTQFEMMQAQFAQMQEAANRKAEQMFTRWQAEQEQRQKMTVWAQNATTATMQRQYALSCTADDLTNLLAETPAGPRAKWQALLDSTLANGFVSFEEIGSSGGDDPRDARAQYEALVEEKMKAGNLSRFEALKAVNKANPDLYAQQTAAKKGGR